VDAASAARTTSRFMPEANVMAEVVYQAVFQEQPLPSTVYMESAPIDVNGARTVHVILYTRQPFTPPRPEPEPPRSEPAPVSEVSWSLSFGPTPSGPAYLQSNSGTVQDGSPVALAVPVFGPSLVVAFENQGSQEEMVGGTIYFISEVL
jgi:hypothetical protein